MAFPNIIFGPSGQQFARTTDRRWPLGTQLILQDGRKFRYGGAGATAVAAGLLMQTPLAPSTAVAQTFTSAHAVGARDLSMTLVGTSRATNSLQGGYMQIEDNQGGGGHIYLIDSNTRGATTSSAVTVTLTPGEGLAVAVLAGNTASFSESPYKNFIVHPSPPTARVLGWTATSLTSNFFGWLGTAGLVSGLSDGTLVVNNMAWASASVDGAVAPQTTAVFTTPALNQLAPVARVHLVGATTGFSMLNAVLDQ